MNATSQNIDLRIAHLFAQFDRAGAERHHVFQSFETEEFLIEFNGITAHTPAGHDLPSYSFHYEALFSSFGLDVTITYDEIHGEGVENASYDVAIYAGGDAVRLDTTQRAIAAVVKAHIDAGFNVLDASE